MLRIYQLYQNLKPGQNHINQGNILRGESLVFLSKGLLTKYNDRFLNFFHPWLIAILNKIYDIYLVTLTFHEPPSLPCCQHSL